MSGTRRTEDLHSAKMRQFIFQNPDGSFPPQGAIMAATDSRGSIAPTRDINVDSVTATTINVTGATTYEDLTVGTLNVTSGADFSGQLNVTDGNIRITNGNLFAPNVNADFSVTTQFLTASSTIDCSGTLTAGDIISNNSVNASSINAPGATFTDLTVTNTASIFNITTRALDALDLIKTPLLTVDNPSHNALATIEGTLQITGAMNIISGSATINGPLNIIGTAPITSNKATIANITSTSIKSTDISAQHIRAADISTNYLWAANAYIGSQIVGSYNFTDLSATHISAGIIDVSSINVSGALNLSSIIGTDISANIIRTNGLISTVVDTPTINLNGATTTGVMTYNDISGLFINGVSVINVLYPAVPFAEAAIINNLSSVTDIAATLTALVDSYNSFLNIFSGRGIIVNIKPSIILNSPLSVQFILKGVTKSPLILNAPGYTVEQLMSLLTTYGKDSSGNQIIRFSASENPDRNNWRVTITTVDVTNTTYITDITGMPTGSLQLLRYLGFTPPLSGSQFERYDLAGVSYVRTGFPLAASYISPNTFSDSEQFLNNIPAPTYTVSGDPYSLPITFTDISGIAAITGGLVAIRANGNYVLYPPTNPNISILGLQPFTNYPVDLTYLDNYNSNTLTTTLSTTKIPTPTVSVSSIAFNRFTLSWPQPYPSKTYKFILTGQIGETTWTPVLGTYVVKSTTVPGRFTRTSGSSGYSYSPTTSSNCDLSGGGYVSFSDVSGITCIVGLTVNLLSTASTGYGFYITSDGGVRYIQGNIISSTIIETYNSTTKFMIVYDGNYVGFYINGVNRQTVQNTLIGALRLDLKFGSANNPINNLVVAPLLSSAFTCYPLPQNSPYDITIYSFDQQTNQLVQFQQSYVSESIDVITATTVLNVPTPAVVDISNTNLAKRIQWSPATPVDVSGTLYYAVNGGGSSSYSIPTGVSSFDITGLSNTGDISCSLYYTDNYYNSVSGSSVDAPFDTAFGFRDLSANAVSPLILDNVGITRGVGYMFPAVAAGASTDSPWLGYTVEFINFPEGISEISGQTMTLNINVYDVSGATLNGLYTSPSADISLNLSLYPIIASISGPIPANTTALVNATIAFNTSFTLTKNTIIMYSVGAGTGRLRFSTFNISTPPNNVILPNIRDLATAVTYNSSNILSNGFRLTETGSLCEFSF